MNEMLSNMIQVLTLHYLHQDTVEEAIEQGKAGGNSAALHCQPVKLSVSQNGLSKLLLNEKGGSHDLVKITKGFGNCIFCEWFI